MMTELILSDITRMGPGFCIIGLERTRHGYRSVRPLPRMSFAWPRTFRHRRGERLQFRLSDRLAEPPHTEDCASSGPPDPAGNLTEQELVESLRQAEVARDLKGLFDCSVQENERGRGFYVEPRQAGRSVCGIEISSFQFPAIAEDEVRADLLLPDGSRVELPLVDHTWRAFVEEVKRHMSGANRAQRMRQFFQGRLPGILLQHSNLFARIGLTRPHLEKSWLMLDSLFPQPHRRWLQESS